MKINKNILSKTALTCAFALGLGVPAFADHGVEYISPNNDGVKDELIIPLKIKEKRYVNSWSLIISDSNGKVVRTIGNKISLPTSFSVKSFIKSVKTPKAGVEIPSSVSWNGFLDDGRVAPDGVYYYQFTASDDNGNAATTSKFKVIVDNTPPQINLANVSDKIFGEGSKAVFKITQSGSIEQKWNARILDAKGNAVKSYIFENAAPVSVEWNGTDDNNSIVADGVYSYEIESTDLAGNKSERAVISNIIFSAEKPEIAVSVKGSRFFASAPKGKTVPNASRNITFEVAVPNPQASVNSLSSWEISVVGKNDDKVYFSKSGKTNPPDSTFVFDGKSSSGSLLSDGEYRTKVTARYLNGYEPTPVYSPVFVIDNSAPKALVKDPSTQVFNGKSDLLLPQEIVEKEPGYTGEKNWVGKIVDKNNNVIRTFNYAGSLPENASWNGLDDNGNLVQDGMYRYVLEVSELAGNMDEFSSKEFKLDTSSTELAISASPSAFSPNGDGVQDVLVLTPIANAKSGIESYEIRILSKDKKTVRIFAGKGKPSQISWNGLSDSGFKCADGTYSSYIQTKAVSGTVSEAQGNDFIIDTVAPNANVNVPYLLFSPDGLGSRQDIPVSVSNSTKEDKWTCEIRNEKNHVVKTFAWNNSSMTDFKWNGTDDNGTKVSDGKYTMSIFAKDEAGNSFRKVVSNINLDTRSASAIVTAEYAGISPNGDGYLDEQKFEIIAQIKDGISSWTFSILNEKNVVVKKFHGDSSAALPSSISWNGVLDGSKESVGEGYFTGSLHIDYEKGNSCDAVSSKFLCSTKAPELYVVTSPKYFSPDNDGEDDELEVKLAAITKAGIKNWSYVIKDRNGKQFWKTSGKSTITPGIIWDGRGNNGDTVQSAEDYPYEFVVTDVLGMTSKIDGVINVDILVIRDGNKLKMRIPSIIFRSNEADFKTGPGGITKAQADNNQRVLKRVSEVLKKFGDYKITVVGHANRVSDNSSEETTEGSWGKALIPLSQARAQYVKEQISKMGISKSRISVEGKGGTEPVADRKDSSVNWKNRRVEFILEK